LGVTINIVAEDDTTYWDHVGNADVELFFSGWSADFADPSEIFNYLFLNGLDDTNYNNPEVNEMILKAQTITDETERNDLYRQIHEIIMADAPWIVLGYSKVTYLQKPWVAGLEVSPAGAYRAQFKYIDIQS
jgi:ABC-type transport system substrate-binding protein